MFTTHVTTDSIVMWITRLSICRMCFFQHPDFAGDLEDSKSTSGESHVSSEVEHLFLLVGCARNKLLFLTVPQNQKLCLWMMVWEWTGYLLLTYGMWWWMCYVHRRVPNHLFTQQQETLRGITNPNPKYKENRDVDQLSHVDYITTNAKSFSRRVPVVHLWR